MPRKCSHVVIMAALHGWQRLICANVLPFGILCIPVTCCRCALGLLAGLLAGLSCVELTRHDVHLFGFNWSPRSYYMHKMKAEQLMVGELIKQYNITVHPPACQGLYSCHQRCDDSAYRVGPDDTEAGCIAQARPMLCHSSAQQLQPACSV